MTHQPYRPDFDSRFADKKSFRIGPLKACALAVAIGALGMGSVGTAFGQATNGTIHGAAPARAGESVQVIGAAGFTRTVPVSKTGQYSVTVPVGTYTVMLVQDGKSVQTRAGVAPVAGGGVTVNFSKNTAGSEAEANAQALSTVTVNANAIPPIDVTTTNQVSTITAKQLESLPLGRSAQSIAKLAPGVANTSPNLPSGPMGNALLSFNGASDAENAFYLDGMNTTDEITHQGGILLPYGAISEQQTFMTGYGAKYGRSIGGVINQIGKSGTNQWHFGVKALWEPAGMRASERNQFWDNARYTGPNLGATPGTLRTYRRENSAQERVYDAYVSGPIIKDKLTFFLAMENDKITGHSIGSKSSPFATTYQVSRPKIYGKLNWNVNDNNVVQLSFLQNSNNEWQQKYSYDYDAKRIGSFDSMPQTSKNKFQVFIVNYTSYITDDLTLHALFGKMHGRYHTYQPQYAGFDPDLPYVSGVDQQNPDLTPNGPVFNSQTTSSIPDPEQRDTVMDYRLDIDYVLGNHDISVGIDNITTWLRHHGSIMSGPGYSWQYAKADPDKDLIGSNPDVPPWAGSPDSNPAGALGYYVWKNINTTKSQPRVTQRAQYIQDKWQVDPRLLITLGLRNDQFVNYNGLAKQDFARFTSPQWSPRLGFSWDVHGDSTLKIYGNAGRYYLSLPASTVNSTALITQEPFTYTGIDPETGVPTGLKPIPINNGGHKGQGVSTNNDYGQPPNPVIAIARNIHAEYSDNFVLGMQQSFSMMGSSYVFGAEGVLQEMGPYITDDWDDMTALCKTALSQGLDYAGSTLGEQVSDCLAHANSSVIINPTRTAKVLLPGDDGALHEVTVGNDVQGFGRKVSRKYYALNLSLTHPMADHWFGRIIYTWSRGYGNTEGPTDSYTGQGGFSVGREANWDFGQIMQHAYGTLPTNHTNQLKAYGFYQLTPEWRVGGNVSIQSGTPIVCMGLYGPNETNPVGYTNLYHWCGGKPTPPGSLGNTPWIHTYDFSVNYSPGWASHRLNFNLAVFNAFNSQTVTMYNPSYGSIDSPNPSYHLAQAWTDPRRVRFYISYDY